MAQFCPGSRYSRVSTLGVVSLGNKKQAARPPWLLFSFKPNTSTLKLTLLQRLCSANGIGVSRLTGGEVKPLGWLLDTGCTPGRDAEGTLQA